MKLPKVLIGLVLAVTANTSTANELSNVNTFFGYQTSEQVFELGYQTNIVKFQLIAANYQLHSCEEQFIYYYVEPQADIYKKSTYKCKYKGPKNHMSYEHDWAEISTDIYWNKLLELNHEGDVSVNYWTVY